MLEVPEILRQRIESIYDRILERALLKETVFMEKQRQALGRKKVKNTKSYNLFKRLIDFKPETLRFMSSAKKQAKDVFQSILKAIRNYNNLPLLGAEQLQNNFLIYPIRESDHISEKQLFYDQNLDWFRNDHVVPFWQSVICSGINC